MFHVSGVLRFCEVNLAVIDKVIFAKFIGFILKLGCKGFYKLVLTDKFDGHLDFFACPIVFHPLWNFLIHFLVNRLQKSVDGVTIINRVIFKNKPNVVENSGFYL